MAIASTPFGAAAFNGPKSLSPPSIPGSRTSVRFVIIARSSRRVGEAVEAVEDLFRGDDAGEDVEGGGRGLVEDGLADAEALADREQDPVGEAGAHQLHPAPDGLAAPEAE